MIDSLPPGTLLLLGALVVPLVRGRLQAVYLLALPVLSFLHMLAMPHGEHLKIGLFDYTLTLSRVDKLSLVFGIVFHIAALLGVIYALHVKDNVQHVATFLYIGAAVGAVFAGDLITLFIYWELTAVSSAFLVWARRSERAYRAGMRYLIIQVGSGMLLLGGVLFHAQETGSIAFDHLGIGTPGTNLIFIAFGIKCAFPLLHNWLHDAYPESTVTGTVFLSMFTTKLAIYALARGFPGTEMLIWIGATMTAFPIFYAVIENDLRRVLTYGLNNQLGFMVVGIGVGTEMALNGTAAHAFCHILYKALLFMSMGAVLLRAGTIKGSELGGLYKSMPYTTAFCIVGAASISAFPLLSGFISKSLILTATADGNYTITWFVLVYASAGVFHHAGIKIPFFAFFAHDSGIRCKEAPLNMLVAMGLMALICIGIGVFPQLLYDLLPYPVGDYQPYTTTHVIAQLQLLCWAALAFSILVRTGIYPKETRSVNLDSDWVYRRLLPSVVQAIERVGGTARSRLVDRLTARVTRFIEGIYRHHGPQGVFARTWPTGSTVFWVTVILALFLVLYYL